jgi:cell division septation protein DedD
MKKSAVIAMFAFAMLPFSACSNNSEQAAYMQSPKAEENAREAEQAEEEFAQLASKEEPKTGKSKTATHETKRKPASAKEVHHAVAQTGSNQKVWTVQLGAFKVKENAEKLAAKLKGDGFPVLMLGKDQSKGGELYLVHLEPTPNKSEAEKWQTDLKLKSFDSTLTSKRD